VATAPPAVVIPESAGALERLVRSPGRFCLAVLAITVLGLALDQQVDLTGQLVLSACTWGFLLLFMVYLTPMERATTVVVIVVATMAEIVGSVIWGVYDYRLGNLPLFVPAGHGLVYLAGLRLSQTALAEAKRPGPRVGRDHHGVGVGIAGGDRAGAQGRGRRVRGRHARRVPAARQAPAVYAGVFFVVAFLELYGTIIGTWTWAEEVPGLGISDGNPPSGVASGYVFFDIAALAIAPWLLTTFYRARRRLYSFRDDGSDGA